MAVPPYNTVSSSIDGKNINFSHCSAGLQVLREWEGLQVLREREGLQVLREREGLQVLREREGLQVLRGREGLQVLREREGLQVLREREGFRNLCLSITELRVFRRHWVSQTARWSDQTH